MSLFSFARAGRAAAGFIVAWGLAAFAGPALAAPEVVATIKPIHSLVAAVMQGVGTPVLLVKGAASPHTYSLKPSDAAALQRADIVFWTGHGMEVFLEGAVGSLAPGARLVELSEAPGITLLPPREGGTFEPHDDGDAAAHEEHGDREWDMHVFLDPQNAKAMVTDIAETLAAVDPANAAAYRANAEAEREALDALTAAIAEELAPVAGRPFVVFHDAYQYFQKRFGLNAVGSITVNPETLPGAARVDEIHSKLGELDAACVFAEPQFDARLIEVLIEGTSAKAGTLDPEGAALAEGPGLYASLLKSLADGLKACLQP